MKTIIKSALFACCIGMLLTGCQSQKELSKGQARKLVQEELGYMGATLSTTDLKAGYYEENSDQTRFQLRKLAANGVITYNVERVPKPERRSFQKKVRQTGYFGSYDTYQTAYRTVDVMKCFVTVELTKTGKKLIQEGNTKKERPKDRFLINGERGTCPEDQVQLDEFGENDEDQGCEVYDEAVETAPAVVDSTQKELSDYEKLKSKENISRIVVNAFKIRVTDVRNILIDGNRATAQAVLESYEVTPFGRIINNVYNNEHIVVPVTFIYYADRGWQIESIEK